MPRICDWPGGCNSLRYCCEVDGFRCCREHKIEYMMGCVVCQADVPMSEIQRAGEPKILCAGCRAKGREAQGAASVR